MSLIISNAKHWKTNEIVSIRIENKKIVEIASNIESTNKDKIIDCSGMTVAPGFIDMHCHLRDPGFDYKEDIISGTAAAAAGGFTAVACMPNTSPVCDNEAVVSYIINKSKEQGSVDVLPIGAITKGLDGSLLAEMGYMKEAGAVAVSDDGKPVSSSSVMRKALQYASMFDLPVISHCEDIDLADGGVMNEGFNSTLLGLRGISTAVENTMISREIELSECYGLPVHIAHVSNHDGVQLIREAKKRGVPITAETCPHYFSATDDLCLDFNTLAKVNPPLRTENDRIAVIEGLKDGTIDVIATDHAPHHVDEKNCEFSIAASGLIGFETAFALANTFLVKTGKMTISDVVQKLTVNPANVLRIRKKGYGVMECEGKADLTIFDPDEEYTIDKSCMLSKSKNTPFDGWKVSGRIKYTISNGCIAYDYQA